MNLRCIVSDSILSVFSSWWKFWAEVLTCLFCIAWNWATSKQDFIKGRKAWLRNYSAQKGWLVTLNMIYTVLLMTLTIANVPDRANETFGVYSIVSCIIVIVLFHSWCRGGGAGPGDPATAGPMFWLRLAMPDVQNFFHKALAVIFAKVQYLYFRRKLSASSIEWYLFPVAHSMYAEVTLILFFSHTNFHWTKM